MFNNKLADQRFLEACWRGDQQALDMWAVRSFWSEVAEAVRGTVLRYVWGRDADPDFVTELIVTCTWAIYEQHSTLPSRFFDLKVVVRRFALSYTKKYIRNGGRLAIDP
jgi:hypothetical protein